jgi:hypothetical protein
MRRRVVGHAASILVASVALPLSAQTPPAQRAAPCSAAEHRQFDFWIGEWEVKRPDGRVVGNNTIERTLGGCALVEQWVSTGASRGTSLNFYDAATKQWHQTWIDNSGQPLYLNGALREGRMVLESTGPDAQGRSVTQRVTWTPLDGGEVRQHWETSSDGGRSWTTAFDGRYGRKRAP